MTRYIFETWYNKHVKVRMNVWWFKARTFPISHVFATRSYWDGERHGCGFCLAHWTLQIELEWKPTIPVRINKYQNASNLHCMWCLNDQPMVHQHQFQVRLTRRNRFQSIDNNDWKRIRLQIGKSQGNFLGIIVLFRTEKIPNVCCVHVIR